MKQQKAYFWFKNICVQQQKKKTRQGEPPFQCRCRCFANKIYTFYFYDIIGRNKQTNKNNLYSSKTISIKVERSQISLKEEDEPLCLGIQHDTVSKSLNFSSRIIFCPYHLRGRGNTCSPWPKACGLLLIEHPSGNVLGTNLQVMHPNPAQLGGAASGRGAV